ncbi:MAG: saccharopine dehydrogenase [Candidatus Hydrogenedentota bacterium]
MSQAWMIYGANGYTGRLCAEEAVRRGHAPVLAGRTEHSVRAIADPLGLPWRTFALDDPRAVARGLADSVAVLHCAGPFSATAQPMIAGCLQTGAHYLDITGEIDVFESLHAGHSRWANSGLVVIPGVGYDVVPTDCLAAMLVRELPDATHLRLAMKQKGGGISPGTTKTSIENMPRGCRVRKDGAIVQRPWGSDSRRIPFYDGEANTIAIPWGDVATAYYSTGIPNIEVYYAAPKRMMDSLVWMNLLGWFLAIPAVQSRIKKAIDRKVKGPDDQQRAAGEVQLWGEVINANGDSRTLLMRTPEAYALTVDSAITSVTTLIENPLEPGYYTPSLAFGPEFVLGLTGVECWEV